MPNSRRVGGDGLADQDAEPDLPQGGLNGRSASGLSGAIGDRLSLVPAQAGTDPRYLRREPVFASRQRAVAYLILRYNA